MGVGLRDAVLAGARDRDDFDDATSMAIWLWDQWRPSLEPAGIDRESFIDIVVAYRRELWFWLMGERGWEPFVTGLAGRVARRLPSR